MNCKEFKLKVFLMHSLPFEVYKDSLCGIFSAIGQIPKALETAGLISLYKQNISDEVASAQTSPTAFIARLHTCCV